MVIRMTPKFQFTLGLIEDDHVTSRARSLEDERGHASPQRRGNGLVISRRPQATTAALWS